MINESQKPSRITDSANAGWLRRLELRHWQIVWEVIMHSISGVLLVCYVIAPSFKYLTIFLLMEYVIGIINTVFWWKWLNSVDKTPNEKS
jgi:hypothetical protein